MKTSIRFIVSLNRRVICFRSELGPQTKGAPEMFYSS